jgi:hypothetical protein
MPGDLQIRALERAIEISGNAATLRNELGVAEHSLDLWLSGRAGMPQRVFMAVVDLILRDDIARARGDRRKDTRAGVSGFVPDRRGSEHADGEAKPLS